MRYYMEHVEHALQRQQQHQAVKDGPEIKFVWPWAWGVLKKLELRWFSFAAPGALDLTGPEPINIETDKGFFKVRASVKPGSKDYDFSFESVDAPKAS